VWFDPESPGGPWHGAPKVIMNLSVPLPGGNLHYWDVAAAALARDHRVVRLDLAGHGGSGTGRKTWSVEGFIGDIRAVVDATGIDGFTLVGHSRSGTIALEAARQLGERVTGVVPIDSVLDVDAHMTPETRAELLGPMRTDYPAARRGDAPELSPITSNPCASRCSLRNGCANTPPFPERLLRPIRCPRLEASRGRRVRRSNAAPGSEAACPDHRQAAVTLASRARSSGPGSARPSGLASPMQSPRSD